MQVVLKFESLFLGIGFFTAPTFKGTTIGPLFWHPQSHQRGRSGNKGLDSGSFSRDMGCLAQSECIKPLRNNSYNYKL